MVTYSLIAIGAIVLFGLGMSRLEDIVYRLVVTEEGKMREKYILGFGILMILGGCI